MSSSVCLCDIALVLGISVSALSHQLRYLRERHAVEKRKVGRIVYYRLVDDHLRTLVLDAATHIAGRGVTPRIPTHSASKTR